MAELDYTIRSGNAEDIASISSFILAHGPNQWNHLPEHEVQQHVGKLAMGEVSAVLAEAEDSLLGVVTYQVYDTDFELRQITDTEQANGYVAEAVVHRDYAGHGIGSRLVRVSIQAMKQSGVGAVYAMRHADNLPSGRMMEKNGMEIIDEFDDPERRPSGSRRTTVTRIIV